MEKTIMVRVIPGAKRNLIEETGDGLKVHLTAPPVEGKANKLLVEVLAEHFHCRKSQVKIVRGDKSRVKVIAIAKDDNG